jgi:hypothetical protein
VGTQIRKLDTTAKIALNRSMPKTVARSQQNQFFMILSVVLLIGLAVLSYKYLALKGSWHSYGVQTLQSTEKQRDMNSAEDAVVLALAVGQYPDGNALYRQPGQLQKFVAQFSKQTSRDLVVVDQKGMILADTISANIGKKFAEDKNGEVLKTISDGQTRNFIEESKDYPNGIHQAVVPLKNASGVTVGAVILSGSSIFK